ncbi:MAG: hypothetical protein QM778_19525 [Myxococcales bacterium]
MGKSSKQKKKEAKQEPPPRAFRSSPPTGTQRTLRHRAETGERDETYDLVSVLYHALQGAETCGIYLRDAEDADDEDLAEFFEDTRAEHVARATLAKQHLLSRLLEEEEEDEEEDEDQDFAAEDVDDIEEGQEHEDDG